MRIDKKANSKKNPVSKTAIFLSGAFLAAFLVSFFVEFEKVSAEPIGSWLKSSSADCAVVLTGGSNRVREGFDLLSQGRVKKLIISGVYSGAHLREIMPLWPFYGRLDEKDVVLERRSSTTFGNASQTLPLAEALNCRDLLLITSSVHMYRAFRTFRSIFPDSIQIQKHAVHPGLAESTWTEVFYESMKSIFYSIWAY